MKKNDVIISASRVFHKVAFQLQKKSPEILVGFGVVGVVVGAVMACKATTKAEKVIDEAKDTLEVIDKVSSDLTKDYSEEDHQKDLTITYAKAGVKLVKLYAPSVMVGALSITCILTSHTILKKRNIALAATYAALDKSFKDYKDRVIKRFGDQVQKELEFGVKAEEVEKTKIDENGEEKTTKEVENVLIDPTNPAICNPYARLFDELHPNWTRDAEKNKFYLLARQSQANDMLKARGHLFLNEVYDLLEFPRTKAGAVVGWIYDLNNPVGDNFVDFGMFDVSKPSTADFVNGYEPAIWLNFNVCGDILDYIDTHQSI